MRLSGAAALTLDPGGSGDPRTEPMIAGLSPHGTLLADTDFVTVSNLRGRDQLRVVVAAHEATLTGLGADEGPQEFASSRIAVARAGVEIGITGADLGGQIIDCLATGAGIMASELADPDFGRPATAPDPALLPTDLVPDDLRDHMTVSLAHVIGRGKKDGSDFVTGQTVLARLTIDTASLPTEISPPTPGTAVRAFLHALDPKTGRLAYLPSGLGRWRDDAGALTLDIVLSDLPAHKETNDPPSVAFDILMTAPNQPRLLRDLRAPRPPFVAGDPAADASSGTVLHVEEGRTGPAPHLQSPGTTLILDPGGAPRLLAPDAAAAFGPETLAQTLNSTHSVTRLPAPTMDDPIRDLGQLSGATVQTIETGDPGGGLEGRHRGTYVATDSQAVVATPPASARLLGDGPLAAPFQTVRGSPALQMTATLSGPAIAPFAEALRGMTTPDPLALVQNTPQPPTINAPADPGAQVAILRTTGMGGEGSQFGLAAVCLGGGMPCFFMRAMRSMKYWGRL